MQPHSPNVNHLLLHIQPEGQQEPHNEVGSLRPAELLVGFELGTFRFWSQHLNPLGTIKCHYEKKAVDGICWNDNEPVTVISIVHADLPLTTVKRWDSSFQNHIKINCQYCITKYNKYMGGLNSLDALVSIYWIDVHAKKRYWPHYINAADILESVAFTVFKLVNSDAKISFLVFVCWVELHYLKSAKVRRQPPPNIYLRKRSWKGNAAAPENERNQRNHFVEKCSQKRCTYCTNWTRTWCPICKFGLCMETCFWASHMS